MEDFKEILKRHGYRATPGRLALLELLWREREPLTVAKLRRRLGNRLDTVTLYRALEAFARSGLVREVELMHGHAHYEIEKKHHHHLVCRRCGKIEDIDDCSVEDLQSHIVRKSRDFKHIDSHTLEFFGMCNRCLARTRPVHTA